MVENRVSVSVQIPEDLHRQLKGYVGVKGTTIREFVIEAIEKSLKGKVVIQNELDTK